jgi:CHAD domain-containing protein
MENVSVSPTPAGAHGEPAAVAAMLQVPDADLLQPRRAEPAGPRGPGARIPKRAPAEAPPAEPLSSHLAGSLKRRWRSYWQELRRCQKGFTEESVHELRVATRRLISELVLLEGVFQTAAVQDAHRTLKRRLKRLGELRDVHVQRLFIEERLTRFPELLLLREHLVRKEKRLEKEAARAVGKFKTAKLQKQLQALVKMLARFSGNARRESRLAAAVRTAADRAFEETVRRRQAVSPADLKTVHRTRVAFKRFRYMIETIAPTLPGFDAQKLRALALYQRRMGYLQDAEVLERTVANFIARHRATEALLASFRHYLRRRKARLLRQFLKTADQLYTFWSAKPRGKNQSK